MPKKNYKFRKKSKGKFKGLKEEKKKKSLSVNTKISRRTKSSSSFEPKANSNLSHNNTH